MNYRVSERNVETFAHEQGRYFDREKVNALPFYRSNNMIRANKCRNKNFAICKLIKSAVMMDLGVYIRTRGILKP